MINKIFTIVIFLSINLLFSCKEKIKDNKLINSTENTLESNSISNIISVDTDKEYIQIVKQDNTFMLSCANTYNKVLLNKNKLNLELIEPIDYEIKKIEKNTNGFKIYFKEESFYYDVTIEEKNLGISYWKNYSTLNNKLNTDYSFYAIEKLNIQKANLEKQKCNDANEMSSWVGKYNLEVSATHGDGKESIDKYELDVKDLKNIELSTENFKFIIKGDFFDENTIQGDITKVIKNKNNASTNFSPFIKLTRDGDTFFITCPLINQGAGFSNMPYEIEKK